MNDLSPSRPQGQGPLDVPVNPLVSALPLENKTVEARSLEAQLPQADAEVVRIQLCVTDQDFHWSDKSGLRNPILCALQRETNTLWRLYDDGFALEAMPPYRACQLPPGAIAEWRRWLVTGQMEKPEWEVELVDTKEQDGYSLIQHRQTNLREKCGCKRVDEEIGTA